MNRAGLRSLILSQTITAACAIGTGSRYVYWKHSTRADAPVEAKIYLGACVVFIALFLWRLVYRVFLRKRNYFAEEMDHRHALAKGSVRART
jgi:hypothetical protein